VTLDEVATGRNIIKQWTEAEISKTSKPQHELWWHPTLPHYQDFDGWDSEGHSCNNRMLHEPYSIGIDDPVPSESLNLVRE